MNDVKVVEKMPIVSLSPFFKMVRDIARKMASPVFTEFFNVGRIREETIFDLQVSVDHKTETELIITIKYKIED